MRATGTTRAAAVALALAVGCSDPIGGAAPAGQADVRDATGLQDSQFIVEVVLVEVADNPADAVADGSAADAATLLDPGSTLDASDVPKVDGTASEITLPSCATAGDCVAIPIGGPCAEWACSAGHCNAVARPEGAVCATVGPCLQLACTATGTCTKQVVAACDAPPCHTASCSLVAGTCELAALATGTCDDGQPCTLSDQCQGGTCVGAPAPSYPQGPCSIKGCDPAAGGYVVTHLPAGATCSDANPCTLVDACDGAGACLAGPGLVCAGTACQAAACDPKTGGCAAIALDATPCDDGQLCTSGDTCASGACKSGAWTCQCQFAKDCIDANPCTAGVCDAGTCSQLPLDSTVCDDGTACTTGDACVAGACLPASTTTCDDGNACSADACVAATGACTSAPLSELQCSDASLCTQTDICQQGACISGAAVVCAPSTACSAVGCNPATGACESVALAGPCTGTDLCIVGQQCSGGACKGGVAVVCADDNPCTIDSCTPASGNCTAVAVANSTSCGTYQQCTQGNCTCALGHFAIAAQGKESFRSVVAVGAGFVAVGDSDQPGGAKGLFALIDVANQPVIVQRIAAGEQLSFAALVVAAPGFWALAEFADGSVRLVRLDALGNVSAVVPLFAAAQAQALLAIDGDALALATDAWSAGAQSRLARVDGTGKVLWSKALAPASAGQAALGTALVHYGSTVLVVGQDLVFAAPGETAGWVAAVAPNDGALLAKASAAWPPGGLVAAAAVAGSSVWAAGSVASPASASGGQLLVRMDVAPAALLPNSVTVVAAEPGPGQLAAVEVFGKGVAAVGWRTDAGAAAATAGQFSAQGPGWTHTWSHKGGQSLRAAVALVDGSLVAVGGRAAQGGGVEAMWVRLSAQGTTTCL